jgi:cyclophilin family peptidyl-prolyl cis-trans isomerase
MPKTANKRARARRTARVTRAHQTTPDRPVSRRIPAARRRQRRPTGLAGFVNTYPWATTIFAILLVGGLAGILLNVHANHQWIWTPAPKQASCNLRTHICNKPPMTIDQNKLYIATIRTAKGNIVIQLDAKTAPITVNSFVYLANQRFYDGLTFHRVLHQGQVSAETNGQPSSLGIIQGGDPKGNGQGGPGYSFADEPVVGTYAAGAVAMANSGPNTNGSQFFICTADDAAALAKSYNLFGQVIGGLDVAQKIQAGDKMLSVTIAVRNAPTPTPTLHTSTATSTATK